MAKTTVNLDDDLLRAAKKRAIDEGTTLGRLIERGLRLAIEAERRTAPRRRVTLSLPVVSGGAIPDFDIADRHALYDVLDNP